MQMHARLWTGKHRNAMEIDLHGRMAGVILSDQDAGASPASPHPRVAPQSEAIEALAPAHLLAERFCHDISGLAGTLAGAIEAVCAETQDSAGEALDLAGLAADLLLARIRLLRAAWAGSPEPLPVADLASLAAGLPERVHLDLAELPPQAVLPPDAGRVILNVLLLAAQALPRGGTIMLAQAQVQTRDEPDMWVIRPQGPQAVWPTGLAGLLADPATARAALQTATPREMQAPFTVLVAAAGGIRLSFAMAGRGEAAAPLVLQKN